MLFSFLLLLFTLSSFAETLDLTVQEKKYLNDIKVIRMCIDPAWEPLEYFDQYGIHSGFSADYIRLIEKKIGIPIKAIRTKSWTESEQLFLKRKCDFFPSISKTPKRLKFIGFTPSIITVPNIIVGNNKQNLIKNMNQLKNKRVGVVKGYAYVEILEKKYPYLNLIKVNNSKEGLIQVSSNQLDFMIDFVSATSFYIDKLSLSNVKYVGKTQGMDLALGIGAHIDQVLLISILTKAVKSIPNSKLNELKSQWIQAKVPQDYSLIIKIFVITIIIFILLLLWSFTLKRAVQLKTIELSEKEKYSKMLFETSPIALALCDMNGVLVDINPAYCSLIGYSKQDALQLSYWDITPKSFEADEAIQLESLSKYKKYGPYEKYYIHKTGKLIPVRLNGQIIERNGKEYIWSSIEDISVSKANELKLKGANALLEEKVKKRTRALEKASEAKTNFLATMSHELRTPLNGILGPIELLQAIDTNTEEQKELLDITIVSAQQMYLIINDILDFTKIESGELTFELINFKLNQVLKNVTEMSKIQIQEKDVQIKVNIDKNVPDDLVGDPTRLTQILLNLLNNAAKFTAKGSITIQVEKIYKNKKEYIQFSVIDTGIGIDKLKIPQLFQPFVQSDSSTTRIFGGTGLGLSIVKKLVEMLDGEIECQSELKVGSTFKFHLPLLNNTTKVTTTPDNPIKVHHASNLKVLVVDDNVVNQVVVKKLLQKLKHTITIVSNGKEAIEEVQNKPYDLVLMDWKMPIMDGIEATKTIRLMDKPFSEIIIIGLSANVFEEDTQKCIASGMNEVLKKPIRINDLKNAITKHCKI